MKLIEPDVLTIEPIFLETSDVTGAFVCLLHCTTANCSEIDYEKSAFVLIKSQEHNMTYISGYYHIIAFDMNIESDTSMSVRSTVYPSFSKRMDLTYGRNRLSKFL